MTHTAGQTIARYPFRGWVRSTCRRALTWGLGIVGVLAGLTYFLQQPGSVAVARAFGVLMLYGTLFWVTLAKIWWTAGSSAVILDGTYLAYQPLHTFSLKKIALDSILSCAPRTDTQAMRFVYLGKREEEREFYLNLGVVDRRNDFLFALGEQLEARGLVPVPGARNSWRRNDWLAW